MKRTPWEVRKVNSNSRFHRELRKSLSLSVIQKNALFGSLLGDGCLITNPSMTNYRLQIEQSAKQKDYVFWKYEIFKNFVLAPPKYLSRTRSWKFRTISHKDFLPFRAMFYKNGTKILPRDLSFLKDSLVLAIWFMDDGCLDRNSGYILNTQNFTLNENKRLMKALIGDLGIRNISLHRDKKYYRLFVRKKSMAAFMDLFFVYMQPSMQYKIDFSNPVETCSRFPLTGGAGRIENSRNSL